MDDDFGTFGEKKNRSVGKGRRARAQRDPSPTEAEPVADEASEDLATTAETKASSGPPKPSRRVSGWGESSAGSERLRPSSGGFKEDDDSDNDIPVIPELEDNQEEDLSTQVAMAPNVAVNRVATYRELDTDLMKHAAFLTLDNEIDLKLLSKGLSGEADVQEEDVAWEWDRLFTEVTSELNSEWERAEKTDEEKTVT